MSNALGQLPNAPLIYVLAQIKFTRTPKMKDIWEDFHQSIFDDYPESEIEHIEVFNKKNDDLESSKETQWQFLSRDRRQGLILRANELTLHTTNYKTSGVFFKELDRVLSSLIELLPSNIQVNKLGLRYIDLLLPLSDINVNEQVIDKLGMIDFKDIGCESVRFERISNYKTPIIDGEIIFRHVQTTGSNVLPSNIFPNYLKPPPLLETERQEDWIVGLLDFDHFKFTEMHLESKTIVAEFHKLHAPLSKAFNAVTTSDAKKLWSGE